MLWLLRDDFIFFILLELLFLSDFSSAAVNCSIFSLPLYVNQSTISLDCNTGLLGGNCTFQCQHGYENVGTTIKCESPDNGVTAAWVGDQHCLSWCANGQKDPTESDKDCGGGCNPCTVGLSCVTNNDCLSFKCVNQKCGGSQATHFVTSQIRDILIVVIVVEIAMFILGVIVWHRFPITKQESLMPVEEEITRAAPSSSRASNVQDVELAARHEKKTSVPSKEPDFIRTSTGSPLNNSTAEEVEAKKRLLLSSEAIEQKASGTNTPDSHSPKSNKEDLYVV